MRVEQLYPFPHKSLVTELSRFPKAEVIWCQEEPRNLGYWPFVEPMIEEVLSEVGGSCRRARYAGRTSAAAPATGIHGRHAERQRALIRNALGLAEE